MHFLNHMTYEKHIISKVKLHQNRGHFWQQLSALLPYLRPIIVSGRNFGASLFCLYANNEIYSKQAVQFTFVALGIVAKFVFKVYNRYTVLFFYSLLFISTEYY